MLPTVVILCGGRGTRLQEHTHAIPKALVEIGGRPILWHVMQLYASQGFEDFVLCTGYLGEQVEDFVPIFQNLVAPQFIGQTQNVFNQNSVGSAGRFQSNVNPVQLAANSNTNTIVAIPG